MNPRSLIGAAALGLAAIGSAEATVVGFSDGFAVATWTTTVVGNVSGGGSNNGSINSAGAPNSIVMNGGDDPGDIGCTGASGSCEFQFTHATGGLVPIQFNWSYVSNDSVGAQLDFFGILVDGVHRQLSNPGGAALQSGSLRINPVSSFGWYINCNDCTGGNAQVTISGLVIPEPNSLALVGLGLLGAAGLRRRPAR